MGFPYYLPVQRAMFFSRFPPQRHPSQSPARSRSHHLETLWECEMYMYVCMYVCIYISTYVCICIYMVCVCIHTYIYMYICIYVYICNMYIYSMCIYDHIYKYIHMPACMHACIWYICTHMYAIVGSGMMFVNTWDRLTDITLNRGTSLETDMIQNSFSRSTPTLW